MNDSDMIRWIKLAREADWDQENRECDGMRAYATLQNCEKVQDS
jgi:hypothetical protein